MSFARCLRQRLLVPRQIINGKRHIYASNVAHRRSRTGRSPKMLIVECIRERRHWHALLLKEHVIALLVRLSATG